MLAILLGIVWPATVGTWQAITSEPMAQVIAKQLRDRGWDVTIPDWLPFISLPFGLLLFIILAIQLWQQQRASEPVGGGQMAGERPDNDQPPPITIGTNYGQFASVNRGFMHQTVNVNQARTLVGRDLSAVRERLRKYAGTEVKAGCPFGDGEAQRFALEIMELLRSAGWEAAEGVDQIVYDKTPVGVVVQIPGTEHPAMTELGNCLISLGFQAQGWGNREETMVFVGSRP